MFFLCFFLLFFVVVVVVVFFFFCEVMCCNQCASCCCAESDPAMDRWARGGVALTLLRAFRIFVLLPSPRGVYCSTTGSHSNIVNRTIFFFKREVIV